MDTAKVVIFDGDQIIKMGDSRKVEEFHVNLLREYIDKKGLDNYFFKQKDVMQAEQLILGLSYFENNALIINASRAGESSGMSYVVLPEELENSAYNNLVGTMNDFNIVGVEKVKVNNNFLDADGYSCENSADAKNVIDGLYNKTNQKVR